MSIFKTEQTHPLSQIHRHFTSFESVRKGLALQMLPDSEVEIHYQFLCLYVTLSPQIPTEQIAFDKSHVHKFGPLLSVQVLKQISVKLKGVK